MHAVVERFSGPFDRGGRSRCFEVYEVERARTEKGEGSAPGRGLGVGLEFRLLTFEDLRMFELVKCIENMSNIREKYLSLSGLDIKDQLDVQIKFKIIYVWLYVLTVRCLASAGSWT